MAGWGRFLLTRHFPIQGGNMRKLTMAACAAGLAIALGTGMDFEIGEGTLMF